MVTNALTGKPRLEVLGVPVDAVTMAEALDVGLRATKDREPVRYGCVNAAKAIAMSDQPQLRDDVASSDVVLADGMAIVWAARLLGTPLPERVTGIDLMYGLLGLADRHGLRVYCLGASEEVSATVAARIAERFPGAVLAGRHDGYFDDDGAPAVADDIAASQPDILFVAITSPKKERFMGRFSDRLNIPVVHGVGGSFDVMAGKVERAPDAWQRLGLEWLYRVKQEPGRLWRRYLTTNLRFLGLLAKAMLARWFGGGAARAAGGSGG